MKLYKLEIERPDGQVASYVVAPTEKWAARMVVDHDLDLGKTHEQFSLERVDRALSDELRKGLDDMLTNGVAGFATFVDSVGWVLHTPSYQPMLFYRFVRPDGVETFVVAEHEDQAVSIYSIHCLLGEGQTGEFAFKDGLAELLPEQRSRLESILEFGPTGIATYDEFEGWSVRLPS